MWYFNQRMIGIATIIAFLLLSACAQAPAGPVSQQENTAPARVEPVKGTDLNRVILTADAARRIGVETIPVRDVQIRGQHRKVVSYSAVLYDLHGETWVYTNPEPLTYVRDTITIDFIDGDLAVLSQGPPSGTAIVTVGVPELYGTEFGVGE
ncbi:MAG TPA: hypothetical protein VKV37_15815 [Ktedonobacteraceae bacterium]|nr:hypothetical protein [Ktedonobacteraceae bacterium]